MLPQRSEPNGEPLEQPSIFDARRGRRAAASLGPRLLELLKGGIDSPVGCFIPLPMQILALGHVRTLRKQTQYGLPRQPCTFISSLLPLQSLHFDSHLAILARASKRRLTTRVPPAQYKSYCQESRKIVEGASWPRVQALRHPLCRCTMGRRNRAHASQRTASRAAFVCS